MMIPDTLLHVRSRARARARGTVTPALVLCLLGVLGTGVACGDSEGNDLQNNAAANEPRAPRDSAGTSTRSTDDGEAERAAAPTRNTGDDPEPSDFDSDEDLDSDEIEDLDNGGRRSGGSSGGRRSSEDDEEPSDAGLLDVDAGDDAGIDDEDAGDVDAGDVDAGDVDAGDAG